MNVRPLADRVLLEKIEEETKTIGGIIIPDTAQERPTRGRVMAVGSGTRDKNGNLVPIDVQVGQIVLYGKWSGVEMKPVGEKFIILKESDIIAVLED